MENGDKRALGNLVGTSEIKGTLKIRFLNSFSKFGTAMLIIAAIIALVLSAGNAGGSFDRVGVWLIAFIGLVLCVCGYFLHKQSKGAIYEKGLAIKQGQSETEIAFSEIADLQYTEALRFNGWYTAMVRTIRIDRKDGKDPVEIKGRNMLHIRDFARDLKKACGMDYADLAEKTEDPQFEAEGC
ncbi:MAG: hypothetical protein FWG66_11410 [Spirochaetes bacterium]|nr:hypothetical protein [Spirochaetota bacterium]